MPTLKTLQADRSRRACESLSRYSFRPVPGGVQVRKLKDQTAYVVTSSGCSCPDHERVCQERGLRCKHSEMVLLTALAARIEKRS